MGEKNKLPPKTIYTVSAGFKCLELLYKKNIDLYPCYCGIEDCSCGHSFGPAVRSDFLIHFILSGKGVFSVGEENYTVEKGGYFLIRPGEETFYQADKKDPWRYVWVGFNGIKAAMYMDYLNPGEKKWRTGYCSSVDEIKDIVVQMLEAKALTYAGELRREGLLYHFLAVLAEAGRVEISADEDAEYPWQVYAGHALSYIGENYQRDIRVGKMAEEMGLNRSYLSSCFKKMTGESIKDYIIRFRLEKAEELLENTNMPVGEIAADIGYEDALAFSKAFKKKTDLSPTEYRRLRREENFRH